MTTKLSRLRRRGRFALALCAVFAIARMLTPAGPGPRADGDDFEFAVIEGGGNATVSIGDLDRRGGIGQLQDEVRSSGRPVFWFSKSGREYVVRDAEVVDRARAIVEPMARLGAKQGELGAKQGKIGARQGRIGELQGRAGMLQARIALSGLPGDVEAREDLGAMRVELRELSRQIGDLSREQSELGESQRALGAQQAELARQQAGASRAAISGLRQLAEDAIVSGAAQRLHD